MYKDPEYKHKYYEKHKEKWPDYERKRGKEHKKEYNKEWRYKKRIELLGFLGGKCIKCGFSDWRALQIDHINGNGAKDKIRNYTKDYNRIKENPEKYQLLCANCNWIKRYENHEYLKAE